MDALSDVLRVFSLRGGVFLEAHFTAPWAVLSQVEPNDLRLTLPRSAHLMAYHYVASGRLLLQVGEAAPLEVAAGEIVLLPRNDAHKLASEPGLAPVSAGPLVSMPAGGGLAQIRHGGNGPTTQIICGYIGCESGRHPLIAALPTALKLNVRDWQAGSWVETLFRYAALETASGQPGSATTLAKVSELLFVEAVRRHVGAMAGEHSGWLAALRDPAVSRALGLMHAEPSRAWTVEALAERAHLSRSAFAERFTTLVGIAPLSYLSSWRMQLAQHALRQGLPVARVAEHVGYDSEAAFSRAFKRTVGCSPSAWRSQ